MGAPAGGYALAQAFVSIRPDTAGFRTRTVAGVKTELAGLSPEITVGMSTAKAKAEAIALVAYIDTIASKLTVLRLTSDSKEVQADLSKVYMQLLTVGKAVAKPRVTMVGVTRAQADLLGLDAHLDAVAERVVTAGIRVDDGDGEAVIASLQVQLIAMARQVTRLRFAADDTEALADVAALAEAIKALYATNARIDLSVGVAGLDAAVTAVGALRAAYDGLAGQAAPADTALLAGYFDMVAAKLADLQATASDTGLQASLAKIAAQMQALSGVVAKPELDVTGLTKAEASLMGFEGQLDAIATKVVTAGIHVDPRDSAAVLAGLQVELVALGRQVTRLRVGVDDPGVLTQLTALEAAVSALHAKNQTIDLTVDTRGLTAAAAGVFALQSAFKALNATMNPAADTAAKTGRSFLGVTGAGFGLWGILGLLNARVTLFGGALGNVLPGIVSWVHAWHIAADAVLEIVSVWGPAIVGIGVFAAAASQGFTLIKNHMQDMLTVVNSTPGTLAKIYPLTGGFLAMQNAAQPAVFELWGDAINIAGQKSGLMLKMVQQLVPVIDQLGARMTTAINSGGFQVFLKNTVTDVGGLGAAFGNLFGIIGNLMKAVPGYAKYLLDLGTGFLDVVEHVTAAIEPVLNVGLAIHGLILYVGLAVSAVVFFGGKIAGWGGAIAGAAKDMYGLVAAMVAYIGEFGIMDALSLVTPLAWVTVAAAAITGLVVLVAWLNRAGDATRRWGDAMQASIKNASDLQSGLNLLIGDQALVGSKLSAATAQLTQMQGHAILTITKYGSKTQEMTFAYQQQAGKVADLTAIQKQLSDQTGTFTTRVDLLGKRYGGTTSAMGLLNAAGITMTQMIDGSGKAWTTIQTEVAGAEAGLMSMKTTSGVLGTSQEALARQVTTSAGADVAAVQKVTAAFDALIAATTATQGTFDTYAQGLEVLASDGSKFTLTLGKLKVSGVNTKAAVDDLSAAGINLNQAFTTQVTSASKLIDTWRSAGIANNLFTAGVGDTIAPLEKYARGSSEATAQLVALAEEAGYQGPNSLSALNKFLGITSGQLKNTATDTKGLKDIADQAAVQEALLTTAMQNQGNAIASQLLGNINQAILSYDGVAKAVSAYGTALAQSGKGSTAATTAMTAAVAAIVKAGGAMGDGAKQDAAVVAKAFGVDMPTAMKLVQDAIGTAVAKLPAAQAKFELFAINGLGDTQAGAATLWAEFAKSNLGSLANQAGTTRGQFDKLAAQGLNITTGAADKLWTHLRLQYLDALGTKAGTTRSEFMKLATDGLGYTATKAQNLWDTLHKQQLTNAATQAGETRTQFMNLASQLGITTGYASNLWTALHKVASGSPYNAQVNETGTGSYIISGKVLNPTTGNLGGGGGHTNPGGMASGGQVFGGTPGKDSVIAALMPGEVVIPTHLVAAGAVDHLRGTLPGFAAGGAVGGSRSVSSPGAAALAGNTAQFHIDFTADLTRAMEAAMTGATKAAQSAANAAASAAATAAAYNGPGTLSAQQIEGYWTGAGGPGGQFANIAQAITVPESGRRPGAVQPGQPYATTGWGLWQITPGNSEPQAGTDKALLNPHNNAIAAVAKYHGAGGFTPWTTYTSGKYIPYLLSSTAAGQPSGGHTLPGMAAGGTIAAARANLSREQATVAADYKTLFGGTKNALAGAKAGSFLAKDKTSITSELTTLAARQAAEVTAYHALSGSGLTKAHLAHLATTTREETKVAQDKRLTQAEPKWTASLEKALGALGGEAGSSEALTAAADMIAASTLPATKNPGSAPAAVTGDPADIVRLARSYIGRIPYTWGGTGLTADDCSGFTQAIYRHFGYGAPRTSEEQGAWVKKTKTPEAGGLVFFASPAGGPPPGHVAIISGANQMISQSGPQGKRGPETGSLSGRMFTGIPPSGFKKDTAGAVLTASAPLATEQAKEWNEYAGLVAAASHALNAAPKGSWLASHKTSVIDEMATLEKRQKAELAAYYALGGTGLTAANLKKFGTAVKAEATTTKDQALTHAEPGWTSGLRGALSALGGTAAAGPGAAAGAGGTGSGGGSGSLTSAQVAAAGAAYLKTWTGHKGALTVNADIDWWTKAHNRDSTLAGAGGLSAAQRKHYQAQAAMEKKHLAGLQTELGVMRQWRSNLGTSDTAITSWIKAAGTTTSLKDNVVKWTAQIKNQQAVIAKISAMLGWSAAQLAAQAAAKAAAGGSADGSGGTSGGGTGTGGATPSTTVTVTPVGLTAAGALTQFAAASSGGGAPVIRGFGGFYDQGGWLPPGVSIAVNNTGQHERVIAPGGRHGPSQGETAIITRLEAMISAIDRNTAVSGGQGTSFARELNHTARPAATAGAYAAARRRLPL